MKINYPKKCLNTPKPALIASVCAKSFFLPTTTIAPTPILSANIATKNLPSSDFSQNHPLIKHLTASNILTLAIFKFSCYNIKAKRSRSITVSTSGFHPDNAGSTPAEITKYKKKPFRAYFYILCFWRELNPQGSHRTK